MYTLIPSGIANPYNSIIIGNEGKIQFLYSKNTIDIELIKVHCVEACEQMQQVLFPSIEITYRIIITTQFSDLHELSQCLVVADAVSENDFTYQYEFFTEAGLIKRPAVLKHQIDLKEIGLTKKQLERPLHFTILAKVKNSNYAQGELELSYIYNFEFIDLTKLSHAKVVKYFLIGNCILILIAICAIIYYCKKAQKSKDRIDYEMNDVANVAGVKRSPIEINAQENEYQKVQVSNQVQPYATLTDEQELSNQSQQ